MAELLLGDASENSLLFVDIARMKKHGMEYLNFLPKEILLKYSEDCLNMVNDNLEYFKYLPEEIMLENPGFCLEIVKNNFEYLRYLPQEIMMSNPELCLEIVRNNLEYLRYLPEEIMIDNPEFCLEIVKNNLNYFKDLPNEIMLTNPGFSVEMAEKNLNNFKYLPKEIISENPKLCTNAILQNVNNLSYISNEIFEEKPEILMEALKVNEDIYINISNEILEKHKEYDKYMFGENLDRFYALREKGNNILSVEENSLKYMDIFYHKMINAIGIDEVEKLIKVPELSKESIERYQLEYDEKFNELFEKKYELIGETEALVKIFRGIDLRGYESKGKNARFEVFKNINKLLEEEKDISLDELVSRAITDSGYEVNEKVMEKISSSKRGIIGDLATQRMDKVRNELMNKLNEGLTSQQSVVSRIIESKIKASMIENDGTLNVEDILNRIEEELNRTSENGGTFYSPHVLHQREQIKNIVNEFLSDKNVEGNLSKSLVAILKEKKKEIGKGWIRKVQDIPLTLSKEEYEKVEEKLGIRLDATYKTRLREGINEKEAYKLLEEKHVEGVVTFNQIETMFSSMKKPYSEEFKSFYKKNKQEILSRPEAYTKLSQIHNEFDNIINKPEIYNRYRAGVVTVDDVLRIFSERKYEGVNIGNEKFAIKASGSGLSQKEFDEAQKVFEVTKKREGTSIPQVNIQGKKYRGRMLRADDAINLFAGNITTCCQKFGDVGEASMLHGSTEKNGGIFVVEELDEKGKVKKVVGQSWTWRNKDRMCFDNIEISDVKKQEITEEDEKEIMEIYIAAGKNAIEVDKKVMGKLLKEGKINQQVYDRVVLKDVTVGLNQYNDLIELGKRMRERTLSSAKSIVLPKEAKKMYKGIGNNKPWIDSSNRQIVLASMENNEREEIEKRIQKITDDIEYEEPVVYKNTREIEELVGKDINVTDIEKIKRTEKAVYKEEQQLLQDCDNIVDVAEKYNLDAENIEVTMSKDGDWYMIAEEFDDEYYIADLAMVGGVNSQSNEKVESSAKIATFEIAEKMYEKMIEMGRKEKNIRYEATRDTSYINTIKMVEKGLGEIIKDEQDRFDDTDIEMNNVILKPNVEKLEEELKKIKELLARLKKQQLQKIVEPKKEDPDDISI